MLYISLPLIALAASEADRSSSESLETEDEEVEAGRRSEKEEKQRVGRCVLHCRECVGVHSLTLKWCPAGGDGFSQTTALDRAGAM